MNYMLVFGVAVFSSASGALLVTLLRMARGEALRTPPPADSDSRAERRGQK
jgi:hypothetical protein